MLRHTIKQLKLVVPCGLVTFWCSTISEFRHVLEVEGGWARGCAFGSIGMAAMTVVLFLYVMLIPWREGVNPDVCEACKST
ncbi:hypothetical protein CPB85DRAFT_1274623, partial [Mucidula mucida]